jgi:hypothetical protein
MQRLRAQWRLNQRMEAIMTMPALAKLSMGMRSLLITTAMFAIVGPLAVVVSRGGSAVAAHGATEMRRYQNDQWKFELDLPTRWVVMPPDTTNGPAEVIRIGSHENGNHNLIVFRQSVGPGKTAKRLTDESRRFLAKHGFSNFVSGETITGSRTVMTLDFERSTPDGGMWYCRHYIMVEDSTAYVLGFGTTNRAAKFELYDRMAQSFVFQDV